MNLIHLEWRDWNIRPQTVFILELYKMRCRNRWLPSEFCCVCTLMGRRGSTAEGSCFSSGGYSFSLHFRLESEWGTWFVLRCSIICSWVLISKSDWVMARKQNGLPRVLKGRGHATPRHAGPRGEAPDLIRRQKQEWWEGIGLGLNWDFQEKGKAGKRKQLRID